MAEIKYIDKSGNYVESNSEEAAFYVNLADPDAMNFVDQKRKEAGLEEIPKSPAKAAPAEPESKTLTTAKAGIKPAK